MRLAVSFATLARSVDSEEIFTSLFAGSETCFWLDSARLDPGLSRFSFAGSASGPLAEVLVHQLGDSSASVFDLLAERLAERRLTEHALPFDLLGYVGWFGYELRAECGSPSGRSTGLPVAETPDAAWLFADRYVVVDHQQGVTYAVVIHESGTEPAAVARSWLNEIVTQLTELGSENRPAPAPLMSGCAGAVAGALVRDREHYLADIAACQAHLVAGDSYEVCLTTALRLPYRGEDLDLYRALRRENPAPYSAFLRIAGVSVFSSSPERFLRVDRDGGVESRPIKGTARRDPEPAVDAALGRALRSDPKSRAENTMIVDLVRNDLGRVCEVGSVRVDKFLAVESYASVHQLVSTVRGRLAEGFGTLDCVRACFPPGSMTGAPKLRTMEIINEVEGRARGIYSGALGYLGLDGSADLSVVIRTAVRVGDELSIGTGGAIVLDSVAEDEYAEIVLKADSLVRAWAAATAGRWRWDGVRLVPVPAVAPEPVVADSWLVDEGSVRAFERHAERFTAALETADDLGWMAGIASIGPRSSAQAAAFLAAVAAALPEAGRWFPRIEASDALYLWLRPAPRLGTAVRLWICPEPDVRTRPGVKGPDLAHLNRLHERAVAHDADEAVLCDRTGHLLEGGYTSLLWWRGDVLCLPPRTGRLDGITAQLLVEGVRAAGGTVREEAVRPWELDGLEVWAVNALHGLRTVSGWSEPMSAGPPIQAPRWRSYLRELGRAPRSAEPRR